MSRPSPAMHPVATGRPTPTPHVASAPSVVDDREQLVRADLADTARRLGQRTIARVIERTLLDETEIWEDLAHDFERAGHTRDDRALASNAARAVKFFAQQKVFMAVAELADFCGLSVEEWLRVTRAEQGR